VAAPGARVDNFGAGPATLPLPVLKQVQEEVLNFRGTGMSMLELSHRNAKYEEVQFRAEALLRELLGIQETYSILFLQGGASLQFAMLPLNFLPEGKKAGYLVTGAFAEKAFKEAQDIGDAVAIASSKTTNYDHIPSVGELDISEVNAYVHLTSNNTIYGTQWCEFPDVSGIPLVADMSSDILSRKINVDRFSLIYAGAQKNLGAAGVTVVIVKKAWLEQAGEVKTPTMLRYATHVKQSSRYNTPPTFAVYVLSLVLEWVKQNGGLAGMESQNARKAKLLYQVIDNYPDFYRGHAIKDSRSSMNVTFRLPDDETTKILISEAKNEGFTGISGHRSVGGCRVSLYNGVSLESVNRFADFLEAFYHRHQ
jgi:phosphoserine aminotransferase